MRRTFYVFYKKNPTSKCAVFPTQDDFRSFFTYVFISFTLEKLQKLLFTIDFLEMLTPMGESLCHLARIDVKGFLESMLC